MVLNRLRHNQVVQILLGKRDANAFDVGKEWLSVGCLEIKERRMEGAALGSPVHVVSRRAWKNFLTFSGHSSFRTLSLADISQRKQTQAETIWSTSRAVPAGRDSCGSQSPNMPFIYPGRLPMMLFRDQTRRPCRKSKDCN